MVSSAVNADATPLYNLRDSLAIMGGCVNLNFYKSCSALIHGGGGMISSAVNADATFLSYSRLASFRLATMTRTYFSGWRYFLATRRTSSRVMDRIREEYFSG